MRTELKYGILIFLVGGFFSIELGIGIKATSLALQSDAFHMLSDLLALIIGFTAHRLTQKQRRINYTYGWIRAEIIGGLVNSVFLLALCFTITIEIIEKFVDIGNDGLNNTELEDDIDLVLIVASIGLLINILGLFLFHDHHNHDHGNNKNKHNIKDKGNKYENEDNDEDNDEGKDEDKVYCDDNEFVDVENPSSEDTTSTIEEELVRQTLDFNQQAVLLHVFGDMLGSIVVIISSLMIKYIDSEWKFIMDPLASLGIVIFIATSSITLFKKTSMILLHRSPTDVREISILEKIKFINGVMDVHEFHLWPLTNSIYVASLHVKVDREYIDKTDVVIKEINIVLHENNIHSCTIQPEFEDICLEHVCKSDCKDLKCC
tara:strand:- start:1256 stop:2383 length:1128 start_codon:yes stop_codon:yes gene_type:complete